MANDGRNDDLKKREQRSALTHRLGDLPDTQRVARREWPRTQDPGRVPPGGMSGTFPAAGVSPPQGQLDAATGQTAGIDVPLPVTKRVTPTFDSRPINADDLVLTGVHTVRPAEVNPTLRLDFRVPAARVFIVRQVSLLTLQPGPAVVANRDIVTFGPTGVLNFDVLLNGAPQNIVQVVEGDSGVNSLMPLSFDNLPCWVICPPDSLVTFYVLNNGGGLGTGDKFAGYMYGQLLQTHGVPANFEVAEG